MSDSALRTIPHVVRPLMRDYRLWEVSDKTKITLTDLGGFALKADSDGFYSTGADLLVRSPLLEATALRSLVGFAAETVLPKNSDNQLVGSVTFRLNNGTNDYYWSGAAWMIAGAGNWNTAAEIHQNAASYSTTSRALRVVINLATTNKRYTPSFRRAVVMASYLLYDEVEDALERSLLPALSAGIRPEVDIVIEWAGGDSVDFAAIDLEEPPGRSRTVVAAYNLTDDPGRTTDLLAGYAAGVATLTAAQDANDNVALVVAFEPVVAITTHVDFDEVAGLPAITITGIDEVFVGELPSEEYVYNPADASAVAVDSPRVVSLKLAIMIRAARLLDYQRTVRELLRFVRENPVLRSQALGVDFDLVVESSPAMNPSTGTEHILQGPGLLRLSPIYRWLHGARAARVVQQINIDGDVNAAVTE